MQLKQFREDEPSLGTVFSANKSKKGLTKNKKSAAAFAINIANAALKSKVSDHTLI